VSLRFSAGVDDLATFLFLLSPTGGSCPRSLRQAPAQQLPLLSADTSMPPLSFTALPGPLGGVWCTSAAFASQFSGAFGGEAAGAGCAGRGFALDAARLARLWLCGGSGSVAREVEEVIAFLGSRQGGQAGAVLVGSAAVLCAVGDVGLEPGSLLAARRQLQGAPLPPLAHPPGSTGVGAGGSSGSAGGQAPLPPPLTEAQCAALFGFLRLLAVALGASLAALPTAAAAAAATAAGALRPPLRSPAALLELLAPPLTGSTSAPAPPAAVTAPPEHAFIPCGSDTLQQAAAAMIGPEDRAWAAALVNAPVARWPELLASCSPPPSFCQGGGLPAAPLRNSGVWAEEGAAAFVALCKGGGAAGALPWNEWVERVGMQAPGGGAAGGCGAFPLGSSSSSSGVGGSARVTVGRVGVGPRSSLGRRSLGFAANASASASASASRSSSVSSTGSIGSTGSVGSTGSAEGGDGSSGAAAGVGGTAPATKDPKKFFTALAAGGKRPALKGAAKPTERSDV